MLSNPVGGVNFALTLSARFLAVALVLQTVELLQIRHAYRDDGIWRWKTLEKEFRIFSSTFQKLLNLTLCMPNFTYTLIARLIAALVAFFIFEPVSLLILFVTSLLVCLRWRGTFNGGSDYMTIVILLSLLVSALFPENDAVALGAVWYISLQTISSYFVSGVAKLKRKNWRNGTALPGFVDTAVYGSPTMLKTFLAIPGMGLVASWGIIVFECSLPAAILHPAYCIIYVTLALAFHLANFYLFGLNRFLYVWLAAYPAMLFCSRFVAMEL